MTNKDNTALELADKLIGECNLHDAMGYDSEEMAEFPKDLRHLANNYKAIHAELERVKAESERLRGLLSVAICPNCDGSGAIVTIGVRTVAVCCGQPLSTGECCGNPDPAPEQYQDVEQCQWCYEKALPHKEPS